MLQALCRQYIEQFSRAQALARAGLPKDLGRAGLLQKVQENAQEIFALRVSNDELLRQIVLDRRAEDLTPEDVQILIGFADELVSYAIRLDAGIAYRVHKLLYEYARLHDDVDLCVRELYYQGLTLYYCNYDSSELGINLLGHRISALFDAGAAYLPRFEELTNSKTRDFIIRCLGNRRLGREELNGPNDHTRDFSYIEHYDVFQRLFQETMDVIESPHYRALAPELPWDNYAYTTHFAATRYVGVLRDQYIPEIAQNVLRSAEYVYQWRMRGAKDGTNRFVPSEILYRYAAARYHAGVIDADTMMLEMLALRTNAARDDYSLEGQRVNAWLPLMTNEYLVRMPPNVQQRYAPMVQDWMDGVDDYLLAAPADRNANALDDVLIFVSDHRRKWAPDLEKNLLGQLLVRHPQTYIHSRMVAELTRWLFERMADVAPEQLIGMLDVKDADELAARHDELAQELYSCGLYHDLGKNKVLRVIGLYGRRLLDEEFAAIQCHPMFSWQILRSFPGKENEALAALYHHLSCSGLRGYPRGGLPDLPARLRRAVDLLVVADTIDAATDNIGRSYAQAKSLQVLLGELRAGSGERYSAEVVALFDDPDFCEATEKMIKERRKQTYFEIYSRLDGEPSA